MSVRAMVREFKFHNLHTANDASLPNDDSPELTSGPTPSSPPPPNADVVDQLTRYIPSEVVGTYIAITTLFNRDGYEGWLWLTLAAFLIFTPIAIFAVAYSGDQGGSPLELRTPKTWPKWQLFAGTISFAAWALAVPTPALEEWSHYDPLVGGAAVIFIALVLGYMSKFFVASPERRLAT